MHDFSEVNVHDACKIEAHRYSSVRETDSLLILSLEDCLEAEINVPDRVKEGMFIIDR
jgi:hypothetical protein